MSMIFIFQLLVLADEELILRFVCEWMSIKIDMQNYFMSSLHAVTPNTSIKRI